MALKSERSQNKMRRGSRYNLKGEERRRRAEHRVLSVGSAQDRDARSWPARDVERFLSVLAALYTFIIFISALLFTPLLIFIYIATSVWRSLWFSWLERRYPHLEFVRNTTARTAIDTRRNQGILTILLQVKSPCQVNLIRNRIQEDILDRHRRGRAAFPHLKSILTSRWGRYGWVRGSEKHFKLDNHIVLANPLFKGRNISEANIQECVTDLVSKLLPPELPPWQVTLLPAGPDRSFMLIRLHHLYSSEDHLTLGDILMLRQDAVPLDLEEDLSDNSQHLLAGIFKPPIVIPQIFQHISESLSNHWNEFRANYDPLENPSIEKKRPYLVTFLRLILISVVVAVREHYFNPNGGLRELVETEMKRRRVRTKLFWRALSNTLRPGALLCSCFTLAGEWVKWGFRLPRLAFRVVRDTPVYLYWLYLAHYAVQELFYLFKIIYNAPRVIFEEVFLPEHPANVHRLQTLSFCGRKVVSWSEPVPAKLVKRVRLATGASTSEIILSAAACSVRDYFQSLGWSVPEAVMTTARFMPREQLLREGGGGQEGAAGMLCLPLPTNTPPGDPVACLGALQSSLFHARSRQAALYLASIYRLDYGLFTTIFPTLFAKACLYLLSRRYAVTITQIDSATRVGANGKIQLLWGPEVERVMYWRPPQANVCLSLTLMSYADQVQLGVMADAQLSPHHCIISHNFSKHLYLLASSVGISCSPLDSLQNSEPPTN